MNNAAEDLWTTNRDTWGGNETHPNTGNNTQEHNAHTNTHTHAKLNSDTLKTKRGTSAFVTAITLQLGRTMQTNEMTSKQTITSLPLV